MAGGTAEGYREAPKTLCPPCPVLRQSKEPRLDDITAGKPNWPDPQAFRDRTAGLRSRDYQDTWEHSGASPGGHAGSAGCLS